MLGVHRLTSGRADYYLADLAGELPVSGRDGRGDWCGGAAAGLALEGAVDPEPLRSVLEGRHPDNRRRLRSDQASVLGYDLTFSAPKSASLLLAFGDPEAVHQVLVAQHEAVRGGLSYLEQHGLSARRSSGEERRVIPTGGMVAASFTHGVNRNLDPHLHTHVVMANLVHGEGRWSACDQRGLRAHRNATGAVYDAHLRAELSARLGVGWSAAAGRQAEVRGVSPLLLGEFSSRAAEVRRRMAQWGAHSGRGAHVAWAATRPDKAMGLSFDQLRAQWERRSRSLGDTGGVPALLGPAVGAPPPPTLDEHRFRATLSWSPDGAARRRDVVEAFGAGAVAGVPAPALQRLVDLWVSPVPAVGVAEGVQPLRRVVPGDHVLAALGPRPLDPDAHEVWRSGALAIDAYRRRWGVTAGDALGVRPDHPDRSGLATLPAARLADHVRTERQIETVRQRLGWCVPRALEMDRGR